MRPQLPERDESANLQAFLLAEDLSVRDTVGIYFLRWRIRTSKLITPL
jgi:hypothetical protein